VTASPVQFPEGIVDVDGVLSRPPDAKLSVFDRGVLYGDSAFEAMRTYGGRAFRQRAHLERLARSCERLRITLPLSLDALAERVERAVAQSGQPECYLRVLVTRGVGPMGLDLALGQQPSVVIFALALPAQNPQLYAQGIAVGLVHTLRSADGTPAAGAKTSNYLATMLALDSVKARGAQEVLILDAAGEIVEGGTSNLFVVKNGALATPPASAGILVGITRTEVFELAAAQGRPCEERALRMGDLLGADEAFITSSIRELVPVVRADAGDVSTRIGSGQPGPVFRALHAAYRAQTQARPG